MIWLFMLLAEMLHREAIGYCCAAQNEKPRIAFKTQRPALPAPGRRALQPVRISLPSPPQNLGETP